MGGLAAVVYGVIVYALVLITFLYAVAFVDNLLVLKTVDSGVPGPVGPALIVLLRLVAVQHSVMARQGCKRWWTSFVPKAVERATYVLLASLVLALLYWQWRPISREVWQVTNAFGIVALQAIFWGGWATVLLSTFLINHFELLGLRQVYARTRGNELPSPTFRTPLLSRHVPHPIYLGRQARPCSQMRRLCILVPRARAA